MQFILESAGKNRNRIIFLLVFWALLILSKLPFLTQEETSTQKVLFKFVVLGILIILSFFAALLDFGINENTFLVFAVILGLIYVFIVPFANPFDESTHFFKAFSLSEGQLCYSIVDGKLGAYMPAGFKELLNTSQTVDWYSELSGRSFNAPLTFTEFHYMSSYIPYNYIAPALGIFIIRLFTQNVLAVVLSSRILNLAIYIGICYMAIRNVKKYRSLFFVTALLPLLLYVTSSVTLDSFLIANCFLFISICFKYRFDAEDGQMLSKLDTVLLIVSAASVFSSKYLIYSFILLLFFMIPKKMMSKKQRILIISVIIIEAVFFLFLQIYYLKAFPYTEDRNGDTDIARQIQYILHHFEQAVAVFAGWIFKQLILMQMDMSFTGVNPISIALCVFIVFCSLFCVDKDRSDRKSTSKNAVFFTIICLVIVFLMMVAEYLGFTAVGASSIAGLQSRYFYPFMVLIMFIGTQLPFTGEFPGLKKNIPFILFFFNTYQIIRILQYIYTPST